MLSFISKLGQRELMKQQQNYKHLNVDGVGMGIELAGEHFREDELNRFSKQDSIFKAFEILKNIILKELLIILSVFQIKMKSLKNNRI